MPAYVRKLQVPVRLSQPNLAPRDGSFQLYPTIGKENRPETVLELLNSERSVIPFILEGDATVLLLTRMNVDWVALGPGVETRLVAPPNDPITHEQRAELRFIDESRVEAMLRWNEEQKAVRLSDFLNATEAFLAARTGFGTLIVNKARIREMRIIGDTQRVARTPPEINLDDGLFGLRGA
jgi:hypothetical protein